MTDTQLTGYMANIQCLYKQLSDSLTRENKLSANITNIKLEKQGLIGEKRALQKKYDTANSNIQKLNDYVDKQLVDYRNMEKKLKSICDSNIALKLLNQNWTTENHNNLKEKIKSLNESLKETIKDY